MRNFEARVKDAVLDGEIVETGVKLLYNGADEVPYAVEVFAEGSRGFYFPRTIIPNRQ
jgi:hypothetical protein